MSVFPPRILSIRQPWVWAIFELGKDVENRTWRPTDYIVGSRILIHVSRRGDLIEPEELLPRLSDGESEVPRLRDLPTSCIFGSVRIAGFVSESTSRWYMGPIGWLLEDPRPLEEPVPCRGRLGLWAPARELLVRIPEDHWTR